MESFEGFRAYPEHTEQPHNSLEFFGNLSTSTISDELKKKCDAEGNTLLHAVATINAPNREFIKLLVVDRGFSVLEKNFSGEDVWIYGMRRHASDPQFFEYFDLLYHGPTKIQWLALCGESQAVHDALDDDLNILFVPDQRGFPLIYYAWTHKTLLKQLLEKGALADSDPKTYKKVMDMWLFRGQHEAKCGRAKQHKKMLEAIKIVFNFSKDLLKAHGAEFADRAAYVGCDLLKAIFERLACDQHTAKSLVNSILLRIAEERKKPLNTYYGSVLQQTYNYLANA